MRDYVIRVPEEAKRMACVTQKDGKMQQMKRRLSPYYIVEGTYCSTKTTTTRRPPATKWRKSVKIWALMSEVKINDHTYV